MGLAALLVPGVALVWAFYPRLDWAKQVVLAVVFALTVPPAGLFILNMARGTPVTFQNTLWVAGAVTVGAIGWRLVAERLPRKV